MFKVELENKHQVLAHVSGACEEFHPHSSPATRVAIELARTILTAGGLYIATNNRIQGAELRAQELRSSNHEGSCIGKKICDK